MNYSHLFSNNKLYVLVAKASTIRRNKYEFGKWSIDPTISSCIQNSSDLKRPGEEAAGLRCGRFLGRLSAVSNAVGSSKVVQNLEA